MKFLFLILFAGLFFCGYSQSILVAKGNVFNDANKNGLFDKGERGIGDVLVSNREDVVKTDVDGFYKIPIGNPAIIFLTKPTDFKVPLNDKNLPQFYYIHEPEGSPTLEFPGIKPTGELPAEINFPLIEEKDLADFRVLVMADVQAASIVELGYFRDDVISPALNQKYDFAISLGDLIHDNPGLFPDYINSMALLRAPHYNVMGNHDVNYDANEQFSDDSFKSLFGPEYYSFDYGKVHFIVLENIERFCKKGDVEAYWNCYRGKVGEKQLAWLKNDLKNVPPEKMVVVCQHIAFEKNKNAGERDKIVNMQEVFDILKGREKLLVLSGHKHTLQHDYFNTSDGWQGKEELHQIVCSSACGSWWTGPRDERGIPTTHQTDGVPNGYFILEFKGDKMVHNYFPAGNIQEQMRIESPVGKISESQKEIIVNVYNSNKHSVVVAEIDGKGKIELKNEIRKDPFIDKSFKNFRNDYKSWASPSESTQLWIAYLPENLAKGFHTIKVKAKDEFNRVYTSHAVFEVE